MSLAPRSAAPEIAAGIPSQFAKLGAEGDYQPARWWESFEDPVLNALLDEALAKNFDLAEATARLRAAEARAKISRSGLFPQVNAGLGSSYSESPTAGTSFGAIPGAGASRIENETYSSSLAFSYELDIWGKLRNDARAGRADANASAADLQSVRLAVLAETITSYFDIVDARHQIGLATKIIDVLGDRLEQTEDRYRRGLVTSFELYQAQRPDIYAEGQRLESARYNLGARRAERFPSLSLSASTGSQGGNPSQALDIFDNWVLNLGANLTAPLFQGGRIRANIEVADAQYAQQTAVYARTVLTAYQEVSSAIERYEEERQRYRFLFSQLDEATAAAGLQSRRFANGVGSYVDYLDALRAQYQVQSSLSSAARGVALSRLAIHRALGGSWDQTSDMVPQPVGDNATATSQGEK